MAHVNKLFEIEQKGFNIRFHDLFDMDDDTTHNFFPLHKKRVYQSIMERIVEDLKRVFQEYPDFIESYLRARLLIEDIEHICDQEGEEGNTDNRESSEQQLIQIISEKIIGDETLQHFIRDYVDSQYTISIETQRGEEELQFKDSYAKLLICVSYMCRLVVPLICLYMERMDMKKEQDLTIRVFTEIFKVFSIDENGDEVDLPGKIQRFITSSVENTLYSDKVIWEYLKNITVSAPILALDLFRKIIRDTIPKLDVNRSVVSFLHVVIKGQINYTFIQNIKVTFKPISQIRTEGTENSVNPFTRMEMRLVSANEMSYIIEKEAIRGFIDRHKIYFSEEEHEHFMSVISPNMVQMKVIDYYVNGKDRLNIQLCNREEYIWLLMITRKFLLDKGFRCLAGMISADVAPKENRKNFNRGKLVGEVIQSRSYCNLLNRFPLVKAKLAENKMLVSFIGDIVNTEFTCVNPFDEDEEDLQPYVDTEGNQRTIIQEILSFLGRY